MARKVKLNHAGLEAVLKSVEMHRFVQGMAEKVAENINAEGYTANSPGSNSPAQLHAEVEVTTTDRARARVVVKHPAALAFQARHGLFTRAASEAGLEVKGK